jgi:hypothetical protein
LYIYEKLAAESQRRNTKKRGQRRKGKRWEREKRGKQRWKSEEWREKTMENAHAKIRSPTHIFGNEKRIGAT